jgi:hypothetical protein
MPHSGNFLTSNVMQPPDLMQRCVHHQILTLAKAREHACCGGSYHIYLIFVYLVSADRRAEKCIQNFNE